MMPGVTSLFAAAGRDGNEASATAVAGRLQADPRLQPQRVNPLLLRLLLRRARGRQPKELELDPNDPLPRTMEELYRQIASQPPTNLAEQHKKALEPRDGDMPILEEAVRKTFKCTEDDAWWESNEAEWDRMAESPATSFALGRDQDGWGMEDYFGEETPAWKPSDESSSYRLSAYKAGTTGLRAGLGISTGDVREVFALTPFGQYWDSVPDVATTGRVYAYNAADRMGALKFMMNLTCNGMHGSAESLQGGHFLWGYVDQLDWMRRSGRLSSTPGSIKVDSSSWWGRVSYALTIIPLAAAVECGAAVSILGLGGGGGGGQGLKDDLQLPQLRRAVRAWKRVWSFSDPDIARRLQMNLPVHDSLQERVRRAQWAAHLESLDAVDALYGEQFDGLPSEAEREFARGWCRAARLFSEAAAHTNLDRCLLPLGAGYAPERMLTGDDDDGTDDDDDDEDEDAAGGAVAVPAAAAAESSGGLENSSDLAVVALKTRRCVASVRWLGTLRAPVFGALRRLWRRSCASYPARREAARVLRRACYGGWRAKAAALARSCIFMFVPDLNYRKLSFPLGVDPAEVVDYDPDFSLSDASMPRPRPPGSLPLNPLQWPWYSGRRPDKDAGTAGSGWGEDDDGLLGGAAVVGGLFPRGREPVDRSFEALQRREREIMQDLRAAKEYYDKRKSSEEGGSDGDSGSKSRKGADDATTSRATAEPEGAGESAKSPKTVFM
eukprot:g8536.t1